MIDLDAVRKLKVQDGDLLVVPENTEQEDMEVLAEALHFMTPGCKAVIVRGPIDQLDVGDMNNLGWYRT
ncbi:hypothetical protein BLL42_04955 [Pseudomonas frederiksbergensis]|uniref:Uncharacterized protein n=1 Tax=Pseudomonas frederiksbergensis TaxID=104087 RepID=A0A1J0EGC9_9PSED|nr:hypothetical protein [Pseudomonas frederiksbergensis]APC15097.1 hypothetical protein BLL42_04955 [Pseudomonas frederiksbergensis]